MTLEHGVGKTFFSQLVYEYAKAESVLPAQAKCCLLNYSKVKDNKPDDDAILWRDTILINVPDFTILFRCCDASVLEIFKALLIPRVSYSILFVLQNSLVMEAVGYDTTLRYLTTQCQAAVKYPPGGVPMLIYGEHGVGKT